MNGYRLHTFMSESSVLSAMAGLIAETLLMLSFVCNGLQNKAVIIMSQKVNKCKQNLLIFA